MRRRIAVIVAIVAGVLAVASVTIIGLGIANSQRVIASAMEPLPATPITATPAAEDPTPPMSSGVSNLSPELIAGLPEYTAVHDRDAYVRIQSWIKLCMRDQAGYSYHFELAPETGSVAGLVSYTFMPMPAEHDQHEQLSLYGEPDNLLPDYDWTSGGCYGQAIHKEGLVDPDGVGFTAAELAQIDEWYASAANPPANAWGWAGDEPGTSEPVAPDVFERVRASVAECLADAGYSYDVQPAVEPDGRVWLTSGAWSIEPLRDGVSAEFDDTMIALYGLHNDLPAYDWTLGGCYGAAVHEAGIPGAE